MQDDRWNYSGGGYASRLPSVAQLVQRAALDGLDAAVQAAHAAGDHALRNVLTDRWHAAIRVGIGYGRPGIASLSHGSAA